MPGVLTLGPGDPRSRPYVFTWPDSFNFQVPVSQPASTSVVPAVTLNTQTPLPEIQRNLAAADKPIPICYGHCQIGGDVFALDYTSGTWTVGYRIALGEIDSYLGVLMNGEAPVAGVSINYYTGTTTQTPDPLLSAAIATYNDDLVITTPGGDIGIAYIVVQYTDEHYDSWPNVLVRFQGRKVWNPKTGTTVYSENPALHLGDFISSTAYGLGRTVDDTDLEAAQDYCDDVTLGEIRRTSYQVIDRPASSTQWADILRAAAACWVVYRGDTAHIIPDKATASSADLTDNDWLRDSLKITKSDTTQLPTVIRVIYTDKTGDVWRERLSDPAKAPGVDSGATPWRESHVRMTGIDRHSQAYREAVERYNKLTLSDLKVSWTAFDESIAREASDVVTITSAYGLTNKTVRLIDDPRQISPGRWAISAVEYDAAAYSDEIAPDPSFGDGNLPSGGIPDAPSGVAAGETTYQLQNGKWASRLDITWTAPTNTPVLGYNISVDDGTSVVWSGTSGTNSCHTSPLIELVAFTITVSAYNSLYTSDPASGFYTIIGKTAIPDPPTYLSGFEVAGEARLNWPKSVDVDAERYEVRVCDFDTETPNLVEYSEDYSVVEWFKQQATISSNAIAAPDGSVTADELIENTAASTEHSMRYDRADEVLTNGESYVFSFYAKQGTGTRFVKIYGLGLDQTGVVFDLATPTYQINGTYNTAQIVDVGSGWFRCWAQGEPVIAASDLRIGLASSMDGTTYTGDGTSSMYIWGAMINKGTALAPYQEVPTTLQAYAENNLWDAPSSYVIDQTDTLRLVSGDVVAGYKWFMVKTIDSINQYSTTPAVTYFEVTLDDNAFVAEQADPITTTSGTTSLHSVVQDRLDGITHYYSDGSDTWNAMFSAVTMTSRVNALASYQTPPGDSEFISEEVDLVVDKAGTFTSNIDLLVLSGSTVKYTGTKPDGGSWTYNTVLTIQATARYASLRVLSTDGLFYLTLPNGYVRTSIVAREEAGSGTSIATTSTPTVVTLEKDYAAVRSISIIPEGTVSYTAVYDNIVLGSPSSFDVYIFNSSGTQVAVPFLWNLKGV